MGSMASKHSLGFAERILPRVLVSLVLAFVAAAAYGIASRHYPSILTFVLGWVVFAFVYSGWTWRVLSRMDTEQTGNHAVSLAQGGN